MFLLGCSFKAERLFRIGNLIKLTFHLLQLFNAAADETVPKLIHFVLERMTLGNRSVFIQSCHAQFTHQKVRCLIS